jgi:hypothetical protein
VPKSYSPIFNLALLNLKLTPNKEEEGMKRLAVIGLGVLVLIFGIVVSIQAQSIIEVTPTDYDFGNVTIDDAATTIVTIQNINGHIITISGVALTGTSDPAFSITSVEPLPIFLDWNGNSSTDVEITFAPKSAGYKTAVLVIQSDDLVNPVITIPLGGEGIEDTPDPLTLDYIIAFFDDAVDTGALEGRGELKWIANKRLKAFRCILVAASTLFDSGYFDWGCFILKRAYLRSDSQPRPPDFVVGQARIQLADMILQLMADLGCE